MKPPYQITSKILQLVTRISERLGEVNANHLDIPSPRLRKQNRIKTIHNSLKIEGNALTEDQVTAILENKRVVGPENDIKEVLNTIKAYNDIEKYKLHKEKDFLKAHATMMNGLIVRPGKYRNQGVGIIKRTQVKHIAPPYQNVPHLMRDLFDYLNDKDELCLIKSCVFHYEMEFIHPFIDGNGRMGRLWQTLILMNEYPVFAFVPLETLISKSPKAYYKALSESDKKGNSTIFIEYMLKIIYDSLEYILNDGIEKLTQTDRLNYFVELKIENFSRKDYMDIFKKISSATASRDLSKGIEMKLFVKFGEKNKTKYKLA